MTISAKGYFFKSIVPIYGEPETAIEGRERVKTKNPEYLEHSNDPSLGRRISKIIDRNSHWIPEKILSEVFVGKVLDWSAYAEIEANSTAYSGRLILFNVGLSDTTFSVAEEFIRFIGILPLERSSGLMPAQLNQSNPHHRQFAEAVDYLAAKFEVWKQSGQVNENVFGDYDLRQLTHGLTVDQMRAGAHMSLMADEFILCHELAHHLLRHVHRFVGLPLGAAKEPQQIARTGDEQNRTQD